MLTRARKLCVVAVLLALFAAVPGSALAAPATPPSAGADTIRHRGPERVKDLDDHSRDPRYARYYQQTLNWSRALCPAENPILDGVWECARVVAPLNWEDPAQGDITLSISRASKTKDAPRLLLTNPGGPGGSGLEFGVLVGLATGLDATHSVVGIDPRGVGQSSPVTCPVLMPSEGAYAADGDSRTFDKASVLVAAEDTRKNNQLCAETAGDVLPHISTVQTARDFNLIRAVLGYQTADYYGVSYGTWLGSVLEKMFGSRIDRVVLDANTDWMSGSFEHVMDLGSKSFQAAYDRTLLPFLARHDDRYHLGDTPEQVNETYEGIRAWLAAQPEYLPPDFLDAMISSTLYRAGEYDFAGVLLDELNTERSLEEPTDARRMTALASRVRAMAEDEIVGELDVAGLAIICNDTNSDPNPEEWYEQHAPVARTLPLAGASNLVSPCTGWPYQASLTKAILDRPVKDVLMLNNEVDPATSYPGARESRLRTTGTARMVSVDNGIGHTVGMGASACAQKVMLAYLRDGIFPRQDLYCQGEPLYVGGVDGFTEDVVYQFGHAGSYRHPLIKPYDYAQRDLSEPPVAKRLPPQQRPMSVTPDVRREAMQAAEKLAGRTGSH